MVFNRLLSKNTYSKAETSSLPTRADIEEIYKWKLEDIYASDEQWEREFEWVAENIAGYKKFIGTLAGSPDNLLNCLKFDDEMGSKTERLYLYAMLSKDSDMKVTKYQSMDDRIKNLYSRISTASSFIRPELLALPENKLVEFTEQMKELRIYRHYFEDLLRTKSHTLLPAEEKILALSSEVLQAPYNAFSMFTNADMKFPMVKDETGREVEISHGRYYAAMYSRDREFRKKAYQNYYEPYKNYTNTFAALLNGNLKANIFSARARNYGSAREAALDKNYIPLSVYDNLIESANKNLAPLHRWGELKKKLLGVDELHPYDTYVTLFSIEEKKYEYDEAREIVIDSLKPMGSDYISTLKKAFDNRWIDVYETQSKKSGAYSSGTTFGVHPYVLLNWTDLLNDVFTLAHEMGHNMHSYYTGQHQPYVYANYSIFLAEVASTFNEALLLDNLIKRASSKEEKLYLMEKYLNNITSTFYRQTMFAEFEMKAYENSEKGQALTREGFCELFGSLYQKYWGPAMVLDEEEYFTWARIPHFYYDYYVYQYATGFAASETLSEKVLSEGEPAVARYLNFLKAGSSDYPINILKMAGVDMNSPDPVTATTRKMNNLLDDIEATLKS